MQKVKKMLFKLNLFESDFNNFENMFGKILSHPEKSHTFVKEKREVHEQFFELQAEQFVSLLFELESYEQF